MKRLFADRTSKSIPEYGVWTKMRDRCSNPNAPHYDRYGGRGIGVCSRWQASFEAFLSDMGDRPSRKHSIERINNDGDYEPSNCRWATHIEQCNNRSSSRVVDCDGERRTLAEWSRQSGIGASVISSRIRKGWGARDAIWAPLPGVNYIGDVTAFGKTQSLAAWSQEIGIASNTLAERIKRGWDTERAVSAPLSVGGERHGSSKLSDADVAAIRRIHEGGGRTQTSIAADYGVSSRTVSGIVRGVERAQSLVETGRRI